MKRLALIALLPLTSLATETPNNGSDKTTTARSAAVAAASSTAAAESASGSVAQQSLQIKDRLQAPAVSAPAVYASGSCASGKSLGVAGPGFGVSGGKSSIEENCERREVARVLAPLNPALALKVLCSDPYVAKVATPSDCVYTAPQPVTKADVTEAIDRAFKQSVAK